MGRRRADLITRAVITAINNMIVDLMAAMSHTDWLSRRQRLKQGLERAHTLGKHRGKQADQERQQKVMYYRHVKKLSIKETAEALATELLKFAASKLIMNMWHLIEKSLNVQQLSSLN